MQFGDPKQGAALARRCNEYASELALRWPSRFGAFATVPMWDMREATAEIEYALGELKHQGVCLFASYGEKFLGDKHFDPVMEALNARAAVVFVHPALHPSSRKLDLPWPGFMMEYVFDTTRAAVNLVFSGAIERFSRIRFVLAHAGELMPFFAWRLSIPDDRQALGSSPISTRAWPFRMTTARAHHDTGAASALGGQIVLGRLPANARVISEAVLKRLRCRRRSARQLIAPTRYRFSRNGPDSMMAAESRIHGHIHGRILGGVR